jgi:ABC-type phosphate transport system substrate-binding protein
MRAIWITLVIGLLLSLPAAAGADIAVIVHNDNPVRSMTARQVSDLYLGRARTFSSGELAAIYEQPADSPLRESFFHLLNGIDIKRLNAYWARLRFSGEVLPPVSLPDSRAVLAVVRRDRNAIGYVDPAVLDGSVQVVLRVKEQ